MEDPLPVHYWPLSNHGECPPILDSRCEEDNQPPVLRLIGRISASALLENPWSSLVTILKAVPRPFQGPRWKSCQIRDFTTFNSCSFVLSSVISYLKMGSEMRGGRFSPNVHQNFNDSLKNLQKRGIICLFSIFQAKGEAGEVQIRTKDLHMGGTAV